MGSREPQQVGKQVRVRTDRRPRPWRWRWDWLVHLGPAQHRAANPVRACRLDRRHCWAVRIEHWPPLLLAEAGDQIRFGGANAEVNMLGSKA